MRPSRPRTDLSRHWAWVLWLALLLPLAQSASAMHAVSHVGEPSGAHDGGKSLPHSSTCDLCLTAAALHGGALRSEPSSLPDSTARYETPQGASRVSWQELLALAYRSRAPPYASH